MPKHPQVKGSNMVKQVRVKTGIINGHCAVCLCHRLRSLYMTEIQIAGVYMLLFLKRKKDDSRVSSHTSLSQNKEQASESGGGLYIHIYKRE